VTVWFVDGSLQLNIIGKIREPFGDGAEGLI
jgi:hypothetical protein